MHPILSALDKEALLDSAAQLRYLPQTPEVIEQLNEIALSLEMTFEELLDQAPGSFPVAT